jgi:hypothetical protein
MEQWRVTFRGSSALVSASLWAAAWSANEPRRKRHYLTSHHHSSSSLANTSTVISNVRASPAGGHVRAPVAR